MKQPYRIAAFTSTYNLLKSTISLPRMIEFAHTAHLDALILIDTNVLFGSIEFYQRALKYNIIPHIGMRLHVATLQLDIIAKNNAGLAYLNQLSSQINSYDFVFVDEITLLSAVTDIVVIIHQADQSTIQWLRHRDGVDAYLSEGADVATTYDISEVSLLHLPVYNCLEAKDEHILKTLQAIDMNEELQHITLFHKPITYNAHNLTEQVPIVFTKPTVSMDFKTYHLPHYNDQVADKVALFTALCHKGLKKRYQDQLTATHLERLHYEMNIVQQMGFIDYFLIIWDVMRFAKQEDIIIGPGRGSAVGSLIAYTLGITKIDPLKYDLLFERFLNSDRHTLPDIDIDVEDSRRQEIIQYLRQKYQNDHVAHILTFGTFGAKSAIRDVAKAHAHNAQKITQLLQQITHSHQSISYNIDHNVRLQKIVQTHPELAFILEQAQTIEGMPRHLSTHAAGIILTAIPIQEYVATIEQEAGVLITQATMKYCEHIGLLKIDFLGLRNLTVMRQAVELIETDSKVTDVIEYHIPAEDPKTFAMLNAGETTGVFQLESKGMRRLLKKFHITTFADIATILALYRPGPMQFIDEYIQRKNHQKKYQVVHEHVSKILQSTHGIMIYQEQVMQLAQAIGGMTMKEADLFRRAMSKKDHQLLALQEQLFLQGAIKNGLQAAQAAALFDDIKHFASYGFNKSHAIAYADIAYKIAYLKAHYPAVFFAGLLNSVAHNEKKVYEYLQEATRFKIKILPLDVVQSEIGYTVEQTQAIRIGFASVKSIGKIVQQHLLTVRTQQQFQSLSDFMARTDPKIMTGAVLRQLINGYGFSRFSKNQKALHHYAEVHEGGRKFLGEIVHMDDKLASDIDDYTLKQRRDLELEAYGFSFFAHPLLHYPKNKSSLLHPPKRYIDAIVYIEKVKEIKTKKGDLMAFITISDIKEKTEVIAFPAAYKAYQLFLQEGKIVQLKIRTATKENEITKDIVNVTLSHTQESR